jgi:hypothetical protein
MANDKPKVESLRKPFYQVQDGLWSLNDAVDQLLDGELLGVLREARQKMFEFEELMSKKYNWD